MTRKNNEYEMKKLIDFTFDLIDIDEIELAKKVSDIANELKLSVGKFYNYLLVEISIHKPINILNNIIGLIGKEEFLEKLIEIYVNLSGEEITEEKFNQLKENWVKLDICDLVKQIKEEYDY